RRSVAARAVALGGREFVGGGVKGTVSSTAGAGSSTVFCSPTSAGGVVVEGLMVEVPESLLGFGSTSLPAVLVATLVIVPDCVTWATSVSCVLVPFASVPTVHVPSLATYNPCAGEKLMRLSPAGRTSVIPTPLAWFGP